VASHAYHDHLIVLLRDAEDLDDTLGLLPKGAPGRANRAAALSRAVVVLCVSAWEAYIEAVVAEALVALRPATPPLGCWPALNASVRGQLGRFNNPNAENTRTLLADALGLPDVRRGWVWQNCSSAQAVQKLSDVMTLRHQIAHGVKPRPAVASFYSSDLPNFFRRLGRCTDRAIRDHLILTLGISDPWPP
jgi:hypothetical protein